MKIVFVFTGLLEYKARLLKQIATLQEANHECILIHGQKEDTPPDYSYYQFEVFSFEQVRRTKKLSNFYSHLLFNFRAAKLALKFKPDAIVCEELTGALAGVLVRFFHRNIKFIFDSNELFMEMNMSKFKKIGWRPIHSLAFRKADVVLHAEKNRMLFCKQHYPSSAKHVLLENLPRIEVTPSGNQCKSKPIRFIYLGALIPSRHCEEIILAFCKFSHKCAVCDLVGFGEDSYIQYLQGLIEINNIQNVRILPPISSNLMFETLTKYDAGFAFYKNNNLNQYYCAPNKIYDYILAELSIITNSYPGLIEVVEKNNIGICLDSINPDTIREAIGKMNENRDSYKITKELQYRYLWANQENNYLSIFS